ncbi:MULTISPECIES: flagellar basal body rod protein FlgB [unclassified Lysinibacillus]|uniref:flagellar basal body rod protein FlgB n=1 Tax=unclassified Lysinibacillus TaxID=2636778 RepID=UPI0020136E82|nr:MULTISPECIES: flagellar basal body rod protein FlgB [unclassified Lysinibacillus]MCL1695471.1 flagellar basal body rod protein FlgB [Lysinibacillus sp. BPa_S21]MCL1700285.1 flagellar basal body rod protein FlgB [Lysinibacillus sp. Bpr_S20]
MDLFGGTISSLENGLSYATLNNKTIANNIANVDTPNYKAKNVSFKDMLEKEKQTSISAYRTDRRHYDFEIRQSTPGVNNVNGLRYRNNGNAVDMDTEQTKLAENQIYYNALIERMNGKLNTLNTVIKGGK